MCAGNSASLQANVSHASLSHRKLDGRKAITLKAQSSNGDNNKSKGRKGSQPLRLEAEAPAGTFRACACCVGCRGLDTHPTTGAEMGLAPVIRFV